MILLEQFEGFYRNENQKEIELNRKQSVLEHKRTAVDQMKSDLYQQQDMVKVYLTSKELEIKELQDQLRLS